MKLRWMLVGSLLPVALVQPSDAVTRIAGDMGGPIGEYLLVFTAIRDAGERVMIDGSCFSACNGLQLYRYRYAWSDRLYVGVLAQEVLEVAPNAVSRGADGYLRVHYARLGLRMQPREDWIALHSNSRGLASWSTKARHRDGVLLPPERLLIGQI
jgi:hypothetical protein